MNKDTQIKKQPQKKRRRINQARLALTLFCAILLVGGGIALMLYLHSLQRDNTEPGALEVKAVTVSGSTRYTEQELLQTSRIIVGQSIFSVDEQRAINNLLTRFPYLDTVTISNPSYDTVHITVTETQELGVIQQGNDWLLIGRNGKALQTIPRTSDRPQRYPYISGVTADPSILPGQQALQEEQLQTALCLFDTCALYGLSDVGQIDIFSITSLKIVWRSQITVLLGNSSNLDYQVRLLTTSLPQLLTKHGNHVRATYDLRAFSDPTNSNPKAYFTPD